MARRLRKQRRRRVFVGCEGESEQGYVALLQRFANERDVAVHADSKVASPAGDPLALLQRAIALAEQGERGSKPAYSSRFLVLDTDVFGQNPDRDAQMPGLIARHEFVLVKQSCCFESFLLRHIEGHENDDPPNAAIALQRMRQIWPDYSKGLSALELSKRISLADVQRAVQNALNRDFLHLTNKLGLSPN